MSERDRRQYRNIKADPVRWEAYKARKSRDRAAHKDYECDRKRRWRAKNPDRAKLIRDAGHAVETAVKNGTLYKRRSCSACRMIGKVEAHHHKGYAPEHWLDVIWLCKNCHAKEHNPGIAKAEVAAL